MGSGSGVLLESLIELLFPIFDQVLALVGTLVPLSDLALAAGAAVEGDNGTNSFCVECSDMMAMCLCRWSKFGIFECSYDHVVFE